MQVCYDLPPHLCCEVHTFISGDKKKDDGLACLAFEKMAEKAAADGELPLRVILWSDGAPNQFKFTRPVWWLSMFQQRFGFDSVPVWFFFQSCHGKGMQDAAGAWIKTKVSRAVLLGAEIRSVRDFFAFCELHLCTEAAHAQAGTKQKFTAYRKFWLLDSSELAQYRATLPTLTTWKGIRADGYFAFWPVGDKLGHMARRWVACLCDQCWKGNYDECKDKDLFVVDGKNYNAVQTHQLTARLHADITQAEDIKRSLAVRVVLTCLKLTVVWQLQVMKKAQVGEVLAIRPGEDEDLINEESGEEILEGNVRFLYDFWLARVKEPYCKVDDTDDDGAPIGRTVHGCELEHGDDFVVIDYLHFLSKTPDGGRKYELEDSPLSVLWQQGAIVPYRMPKAKMGPRQTTFVLSESHEDQILCRLQPITD